MTRRKLMCRSDVESLARGARRLPHGRRSRARRCTGTSFTPAFAKRNHRAEIAGSSITYRQAAATFLPRYQRLLNPSDITIDPAAVLDAFAKLQDIPPAASRRAECPYRPAAKQTRRGSSNAPAGKPSPNATGNSLSAVRESGTAERDEET